MSTANALLSRVLFSSSVQSLQPLSHCNAGLWSMRSSFSSSFEKQLNIELQQSLLILPQNRIPSHSSISPGHILKTKKKKIKPSSFLLGSSTHGLQEEEFNTDVLHPHSCVHGHSPISTFLPGASRTHLCCKNKLADDVCCVLTPIGKPHDLCDSFRTNPIICEEKWQRLN